MKDFIIELYGSDKFVLGITIAIVILVALFVIVLIFGKKDQALEETKRLQKIELENSNKEKEETKEEVKQDLNEEPKEVKEDIKEDIDLDKMDATIYTFTPTKKEEENLAVEEIKEETKQERKEFEESVSISLDEMDKDLEKGLNQLQSIKDEFNNIELPTLESISNINNKSVSENKIEDNENKEDVVVTNVTENKEEKVFQPSQVFSSVFVNKETTNNTDTTGEDEDDFILPDLKEEVSASKENENQEFNINNIENETYKL